MINKKFWIEHFNSAEPEIQRRFIAEFMEILIVETQCGIHMDQCLWISMIFKWAQLP